MDSLLKALRSDESKLSLPPPPLPPNEVNCVSGREITPALGGGLASRLLLPAAAV